MRRVARALLVATVVVLCLLVLGVLAVAGLVATGTARLYVIASPTMEPALHCARPAAGCEGRSADRALALARLVSYDRGDIVTFEPSPRARAACGIGGTFVKRIVGLPGETVVLRPGAGTSLVYIDGRRLEEPYVSADRDVARKARTFEVPRDHYFVLGDDRLRACDSRLFGPVAEDDLTGEVVVIVWPPRRISFR